MESTKSIQKNKNSFIILPHFHQKINYFIPLKSPAALTFSSSLSLIFLLYLLFQNPQNPPFYKALKENNPKKDKKRKGHLHTNKKNHHKNT